jgi:GTP:adenosylcobinamide-phosphate guanylyltransferase
VNALDAVILAGGRSERLNGIVPPFHKPFLVINGKSLLVSAVDSALTVGAERVVVVATGENAMPVFQLVGHYPQVRVVLAGGGPGRALLVGLEVCANQRVLVLMSDNVHDSGDVARVAAETYAIGVRYVNRREAQRFTRSIDGDWVEGVTDRDAHLPWDAAMTVWCGPLVIQRRRGLDLLAGQEKIGPVLGQLAPTFTYVPVQTLDVGVPDVVTELTRSS